MAFERHSRPWLLVEAQQEPISSTTLPPNIFLESILHAAMGAGRANAIEGIPQGRSFRSPGPDMIDLGLIGEPPTTIRARAMESVDPILSEEK